MPGKFSTLFERLSWRSLLVAWLAFILFSLVLLAVPVNPGAHTVLAAAVQFFAALGSGYMLVRLRQKVQKPLLRNWSFITAAGFLFLISAVIYLGLSFFQVEDIPNLSDLPRLAAYPTLLVGLLTYPLIPRQRFGQFRLLMDILLTTLAVLAIGWFIFLQPVMEQGGMEFATAFWLVVFPFLDLIVLIILVNVILILKPAPTRTALLFLLAGFVGLAISDLTRVYLVTSGVLNGGSILDLGRVIGYGALGVGAAFVDLHPAAGKNLPYSPFWQRATQRAQELLPLFTTLGILWFSLVDLATNPQFNPVLIGVAFLVGVGLIARQGIIAGEIELREYAYLVESAAEPAFICDRLGKLMLVNPALVAATRCADEADLLGKRIGSFLPPDTPAALLETALREGYTSEIDFFRQDGSTFPVQLSLQPVERQVGNRPVLAGTAHDLSEQKRQQAALQAAYEEVAAGRAALQDLNAQLEEKVIEKTRNLSDAYERLEEQNRTLQQLDELKTDFVSLVSHELRAPLTNISGGIELVLGSESVSDHTRGSLLLVQNEIRRLSHFVETILDLSALDAGRIPFYPAPLSLPAITGVLKPQLIAMPGVERLFWDIPADLPPVLADERAVISIFFHLIDNALKYAPQGHVKVSARSEGPRVVVTIADEGPGIPTEALPLLFNKFFRANPEDAQRVYGHGLGLYIVRKLLDAMNGEIQAVNLPQGGACFTFWLPAVQEQDEAEIIDR